MKFRGVDAPKLPMEPIGSIGGMNGQGDNSEFVFTKIIDAVSHIISVYNSQGGLKWTWDKTGTVDEEM